ncbi:MAG: hypothetical protein KJ018_04125 [Burkholderiales bacterium]|nr:hypothetical protein [Burkholderiales bacterium]
MVRWVMAAALVAAFVAWPAAAQVPAAPRAASPPGGTPVQPALGALAAARGPELAAEGVQRINARTGMKRRDLQVTTRWGPVYFAWPKNAKPVTFELEVGNAGTVTVRAAGYGDANKGDYAAAFDAVIPEAIRLARLARANAERPRP